MDWLTIVLRIVHVGAGVLWVGGAAAILAWVLGLVALRPIVARTGEVSGALAASGGPPSQEQAAELQALGQRARSLGWVNIGLLLIAVVAMAAARYL
jgi:hypothetical protein